MAKKKIEKVNKIVTLDNNGNIVRQNLTGNTGGYKAPAMVEATKPTLNDTLNNLKSTIDNSSVKNQGFSVSHAITDLANLNDAKDEVLASIPGIGGFFEARKKAGDTITNAMTNMGTGALKSVEGAADTISDLVYNPLERAQTYTIDYLTKGKKVADENLADLKKMQKRDIKKNMTNDFLETTGYNDVADELEKNSLVKRENLGGQVFQGIGGMVPSLTLGQAFGGTPQMTDLKGLTGKEKLAAALGNVGKTYVAQLPANSMLTASAYGGGMEEALNEGATMNQARLYGLTDAAIENLTEMMTGGVPGLEGKGGIDQFVDPLLNKSSNKYLNALLKAGYGAAGEGLEEYTSAMLNPLAKKIYSDEDINWDEVRKQARREGLIGAITGAVLGSPTNIQEFQNARIEQNNARTGANTKNSINTQVNQENVLNDVIQSKKSAVERVNNLNEAERQALTEITMKRKSGMSLDQNDIATINYINSKDNINGLTGDLSDVDVQIPGLEGLETTQNNEMIQNAPITLQDSAVEYGYKGNSQELANIDNSLQKRGITAKFDSSLFDNNNTNAIWTNENGQRQVIFNPNVNENTIIEEIATHELTHDLMSSENSKNTLKAQKILDYVKTLEGYQEARQNLEQAYSQMYDVNSQEFQKLIDEETVADVLGKKLGNQEFVNQITNSNPSLARRIYNWVIDKLDSIVNSGGKVRNEKLFWQNVKNNFEKAYNMEYQSKNENVKYSVDTKTGKLKDSSGKNVKLDTSKVGNTGSLMAIHNLNEDKLKGILELGGFPVPSIAITNPNIVNHNQFGNISVLFNKNTIDPAIASNEVFDRDVWSPTFPRVEYDINMDDIRKMSKANNIYDDYSDDIVSHVRTNYFYGDNLSDLVDRWGIDEALEKMKQDKELKYLYQKTQDNNYQPQMKPTEYSKDFSNKTLQEYVDFYNSNKFNGMSLPDFYYHYLNYGDMNLTEDQTKALKATIRDFAYKQYKQEAQEEYKKALEKNKNGNLSENDFVEKYVNMMLESYDNSYFKYKDFIKDASRLDEFGNTMSVDRDATLEKVNSEVNQEDFNNWIDNTFGKMLNEAKKGIRNDNEIYTASGNRRSFNKLHDEYNLQNIVSYLTNKKTVAGEEGFGSGQNFGTFQAKLSNKFNSIEDIKNAEDRLQYNNETKELLDNYSSQVYEYMNELGDYSYNKNRSYYYGDNAGYALNDFAGYKNHNLQNLNKALENNGINSKEVPAELKNNIIKTVDELKNIPTDYFEAKPQRAVGLDEVQAVVIPNNASTELKKTLQDKGLSYYEYDPSIDGDRNRVINQFDDLKFSKQSQNWNDFLDKNIKSEGTKTALKDLKTQQEQYFENQGVDKKVAKILSEAPKPEKISISEKIKNGKASLREQYQYFKRNLVDKGEAVYRLGKETKNPLLYAKYDKRGTTRGEANYDIGVAQTNLKGERYNNFTNQDGKKTYMSLNQIWDNVDTDAANQYLAHWLNIDRYGQLNESGRQMQQMLEEQVATGKITQTEANEIIKNNDGNRYVFGTKDITPEISRQEIAKLEKTHPELKRFGENVWQYGKNQLQNMVDSGMISQERANQWMKENPHYTRLQRNVDTKSKNSLEFNDRGNARVNKQIQEFKGSNLDILPFKDSMAKYTLQVRDSIRNNLFAQELAKTMGISSTENNNISSIDDIMGINQELLKDNGDGTYSLTFYDEGVPTTIPINEGIYESLQPNKHYKFEDKLPFKAIRKVDSIRKALLTDKNPMFLATNMMKDAFDAPLNSKYPVQFAKNYPRAVKEILTNGKYYQQYQALGGLQNTYFDYNGFKQEGSKLNPLTWIEKGNNAVEQFPRLAEFISTMEATGDVDQAMYNAAEITTNFKRGGNVTKAANRNGATFLNASVQGFSKQIRNFTDIQTPTQAVQMLGKVLALGIAPGLLNDIMWDDDDEYKEMQEYQKDRYYLFKGKDGNWIRIPKGRAVSIFQSAARRTKYYLQGDKDAYKGLGSFAIDQVAPNNPLENNIFSPLVDVARNKSWSGNDIVSDSIKNESHPEEEYTIKTDEFSKWLGKKLGKSPAKINYLIDQYSGAIGDLVLPNITKKSTRDSDNLLENIFLAPFKDKFTTNAATSSKNQNEFYEALSKAKDDNKYSKATTKDKAVYKYLNNKNSEIAKIRKKYVESQESDMSNKEKYEKAIEYTKEMNKVSKEAVNNSKQVIRNGKNEYTIGDKHYTISGNEVNTVKDETVQNAKKYGLSVGDYTDITNHYSSIKADKDTNGNTIPGSKKQKFINYVQSKEELTQKQKIDIIKKYYKNYKGE